MHLTSAHTPAGGCDDGGTVALRRALALIKRLDARVARNYSDEGEHTPADKLRAQGRALGTVDTVTQRALVLAVQTLEAAAHERDDFLGARLRDAAARGRTLVLLANAGFVECVVRHHSPKLRTHGRDSAHDALRQVCYDAINRSVSSFDASKSSSPLSWARWAMAGCIKEFAAAEGRQVSVGGRESAALAIERARADADCLGRRATLAELAAAAGVSESVVVDLLPFLDDFDTATPDDDAFDFELVADAGDGADTNALDVAEQDEREQAVHTALAGLRSDKQRLVLDWLYGLTRQAVPMRELYNGIYRDAAGAMWSADDAVRSSWAQDGATVLAASQAELNARFAAGELTYEPGSVAARELFSLDGRPPTAVSVGRAHRAAKDALRANPVFAALA